MARKILKSLLILCKIGITFTFIIVNYPSAWAADIIQHNLMHMTTVHPTGETGSEFLLILKLHDDNCAEIKGIDVFLVAEHIASGRLIDLGNINVPYLPYLGNTVKLPATGRWNFRYRVSYKNRIYAIEEKIGVFADAIESAKRSTNPLCIAIKLASGDFDAGPFTTTENWSAFSSFLKYPENPKHYAINYQLVDQDQQPLSGATVYVFATDGYERFTAPLDEVTTGRYIAQRTFETTGNWKIKFITNIDSLLYQTETILTVE